MHIFEVSHSTLDKVSLLDVSCEQQYKYSQCSLCNIEAVLLRFLPQGDGIYSNTMRVFLDKNLPALRLLIQINSFKQI